MPRMDWTVTFCRRPVYSRARWTRFGAVSRSMGTECSMTNSSRRTGKSCQISRTVLSSGIPSLRSSVTESSRSTDGLESTKSCCNCEIWWVRWFTFNEATFFPRSKTSSRTALENGDSSRRWIGSDPHRPILAIALVPRLQEICVHKDAHVIKAKRQCLQTWETENKSSSSR